MKSCDARRAALRYSLLSFAAFLPAGSLFANQYGSVTKGDGWTYTRLGRVEDVSPATHFGVMFEGGGTDVDEAFAWMCSKAAYGDFLVIRATGTAAYNPYIRNVCPDINSVSTLEVYNRTGAQDPVVLETIGKAEAIFFAGGAQDNYITFYSGPLADAVNKAAARGVPIGGTSAGNAVLAQFAYSALTGSVTSRQALIDPFTRLITISDGFLNLNPVLLDKITDDHFEARDRMGRLITFLARINLEQVSGQPGGKAAPAKGIAVDEETAFLMNADATGQVVGSAAVYFLETPGPAEICRPGAPLTFANVKVYREMAGNTFDLANWTGSGGTAYTISVEAGVLRSSQPGGRIY